MKFYTWKDIDRYCKLKRDVWESTFQNIEVYNDIIIIDKIAGKSSKVILKKLFNNKYSEEHQEILLDVGGEIPIREEETEETFYKPKLRPIFKDSPYYDNMYPAENLEPLKKPVIAFHSYKGGVGRTLSVIAFLKAWPEVFISQNKKSKLLIIDADIEAPGLTWITQCNHDDIFSYLDLLEMLQDSDEETYNNLVHHVSSLISESTISVETQNQNVEHFFMPAYRYDEQLLDIYATPNTVAGQKSKNYVLATVLSKLAEELACDAVIIDLRAGISEYSSPFLFDSRVKKFFVTSTSSQSIQGTCFILKQIMKGFKFNAEANIPNIFLNMIPSNITNLEKERIILTLQDVYNNSSSFTDNVIKELPFASELIHETTFEQISENLNDRKFYTVITNLIRENYLIEANKITFNKSDREEKLKSIRNEAQSRLTAESVQKINILPTRSLKNLIRKFQNSLPRTIIIGAKGSGKTFLFRKMVQSNTWTTFSKNLVDVQSINNAFFVPVITPQNGVNMINELEKCIEFLNSKILNIQISNDIFQDATDKINNLKTNKQKFYENTWEKKKNQDR